MTETEVMAWMRYESDPNESARNVLAELYYPLMKKVAYKMASKNRHADYGDFLGWGAFGLFDAIAKFDRGREIAFSTFAGKRIAGAMLDGLRENDSCTRTARQNATLFDETTQRLRCRLGRMPTELEMQQELRVDEEELRRLAEAYCKAHTMSIDVPADEYDNGNTKLLRDIIPARESTAGHADAVEYVLEQLSKRERMVIDLYYFQEKTMGEIGKAMRLSESRVSQM